MTKTLNDKKFTSLEISEFLIIPSTEDSNYVGKLGEIIFNSKNNCLMIRRHNSWQYFPTKLVADTRGKNIPVKHEINKKTLKVSLIYTDNIQEEIENIRKEAKEYKLKNVKIYLDRIDKELIKYLKNVYRKVKIYPESLKIVLNTNQN